MSSGYKVNVTPQARRDINDCLAYLADYNEAFARVKAREIANFITHRLAETPHLWHEFYITGAPFRGFHYVIGRRTSYWLVYFIDETSKKIEVLRFWNARQNPKNFTFAPS